MTWPFDPLTPMKYGAILADPPWACEKRTERFDFIGAGCPKCPTFWRECNQRVTIGVSHDRRLASAYPGAQQWPAHRLTYPNI